MKILLAAIVTAAFVVTGFVYAQSPDASGDSDRSQVVRHVVLFKFKADASEQQIREVEEAFAALPEKIDEIADFEWGTNKSPEDHAKGFTHCYLLTFNSPADRDAYLPHPAHKEFGKLVRPVLDDVHVVDYTPKSK